MTVSKPLRHHICTIVALTVAATAMVRGQDAVLELRAAVLGEQARSAATLRIEVLRWSTEAERTPMLAALSSPPAPPASQAAAPPPAAASPTPPAAASPAPPAAAGRGGRGGRGAAGGGRGGAPATPQARLSAAVKAAPTIGFIWADGPTGYSIKYAWQSPSTETPRRIVLVTDRRIGAYQPLWPSTALPVSAAGDAEFTVIELHVDAAHNGEAKTSLVSEVIADPAAKTIALARYAAAPVQLRIIK